MERPCAEHPNEITMTITFRRGTIDDSQTVYEIFGAALFDLSERQGVMAITGADDPKVRAELWTRRRPLFEHLARTAYEFWIAEDDGQAVGYARSILRDNMLELTEFFVVPSVQSAGVGRELLARAFPLIENTHRVIVATTDVRALVRYLKAGVVPRLPEMYWTRAPQDVLVETDLEFVLTQNSPETLSQLAKLDRAVLGHTRAVDHLFLMETRTLYFYHRRGQVVGYGYLAPGSGPMAVLDAADFPAILAHAERHAFAQGLEEIGFDVPMINRAAIDHLLARHYELDAFVALMMSDVPFGKLENYVLTAPAFFI